MIDRSEQLVTVFGGGGFIGRYLCEALLQSGARVRVACRQPRHAHFLQTLSQVGQIGFVRADVTQPETVRRATEGATAVINLVGILKGRFQAVHVAGARNAAEAASDAGAAALIQISAIGADPAGPAQYSRSKGDGEQTARAAFSKATIIRPSLVFGAEDQLTNRLAGLARLPFLPVIAPRTRFQPVYVRDLAQAIAKAALDPAKHGGKTYEIGGPQVMSMREINTAVLAATGQTTELIDMPDFAASLLARFGFLPGAPLTHDQWLMLQSDNLPAQGAPGLAAFGINPTPLGAVAHEWLGRFAGSRFARRTDATAA